jgi:SAM-dependent methyltransferase
MEKNKWISSWLTDQHLEKKVKNFNIIKEYLTITPKTILDIGCGLAFESEMMQKEFGSELYLLDGDFENTRDLTRDVNYGSLETMKFYSKVDDLKTSYKTRNLQYNFVDANNISIKENKKFDLIYSFESCGFHYPISSYIDLIQNHSHENTVLIFDIRNKNLSEQQENFTIVKVLEKTKKYSKMHIDIFKKVFK